MVWVTTFVKNEHTLADLCVVIYQHAQGKRPVQVTEETTEELQKRVDGEKQNAEVLRVLPPS